MADFDITISDGTSVEVVVTPSSGEVVTDHGALTGLADDDHTLYHTDARGDARYSQLGHTHAYAGITDKPSTFAPSAHATTHTNGTDDIQNATASQKGLATAAQITKLDAIETGATADQSAAEVAFTAAGGIVATNVQAALEELDAEAEKLANKDQNNGYAGLNSSGRVPVARLASGTPDGTKFIRDDGVLAIPGGASYRTLVTLGSDVSNSTSSFANVTGLSFSVSSGTVYRFSFLILFESQATSTGSAWSINGPAFTNLAYSVLFSSVAAPTITHRSAYDVGAASTTSATTTNNFAMIEGIVIPSASGTLIARFLSEAPGTNNQITARAGSTVEYW